MGFFSSLKVQLSGAEAPPADATPPGDQDAAGQQQECPPAPAGGCCGRLLPGERPDMPFQISSYAGLADNKAALAAACAAAGVSPDMQALLTAMAMIETTHMCPTQRDATKDDNTDGSANVSIFNLSVDLVQCAGFQGDAKELNDNLEGAVQVLAAAMAKWGIKPTLDFVRGGRTGFNDHVSYGCGDYRRTVATVLSQIDHDPALLSDGRRVEVDLVHV